MKPSGFTLILRAALTALLTAFGAIFVAIGGGFAALARWVENGRRS